MIISLIAAHQPVCLCVYLARPSIISSLHCFPPVSHKVPPFIKFHSFISQLITFIALLTIPLFYSSLFPYHLHLCYNIMQLSHIFAQIYLAMKQFPQSCHSQLRVVQALTFLLTLEWTVSYSHLLLPACRTKQISGGSLSTLSLGSISG